MLRGGLFDLRGHILYTLALLAYLVAYLGFFVTESLVHFVWVVLYTLSPLMILAYVAKATANVTVNLYKGLVKVVVWKILWTVLSVLLLKLGDGASDRQHGRLLSGNHPQPLHRAKHAVYSSRYTIANQRWT